MEESIFETCPNCDKEIGVIWDVDVDGYEVCCPYCGEKMMLCSMCDNHDKCDWKSDFNGNSTCMMMKANLFTWDDIYEKAEDKAFGSDELKAKDEARYQLRVLIEERMDIDIEECECPEEEIERFLEDKAEVLFDARGNICDIQWINK